LKGHGFSHAVRIRDSSGFTGCGKTPVSYQGIALAIPQVLQNQIAPLGAVARNSTFSAASLADEGSRCTQ
jgi:hypothetical protein